MPGGFPGGMPEGFAGGMPGGFPGGMPGGMPGNVDFSKILNVGLLMFRFIFSSQYCSSDPDLC